MYWLLIGISLMSGFASANEDVIRKAVTGINPTIQIQSIQAIESTPFVEVILQSGERIYTDADATHFVAGDLYKIEIGRVENITDLGRRGDRIKQVAGLREEGLIIFSPKGEVKKRLLIFTDIDCGYCRKLHAEIDNLLENGVEVRYAAFPRSGINTPSFDKYVSVVCAENQQEAMTAAKQGDDPAVASCTNHVEAQLQLGKRLGISGTPTLIFEDGAMQPGYAPWQELLNRMNQVDS